MRNLILRIFWPTYYFEREYKIRKLKIYQAGYKDCENDLSKNYDKALKTVQTKMSDEFKADIRVVSERESGRCLKTGVSTHTLITKAYPTKEFQIQTKLDHFDQGLRCIQ